MQGSEDPVSLSFSVLLYGGYTISVLGRTTALMRSAKERRNGPSRLRKRFSLYPNGRKLAMPQKLKARERSFAEAVLRLSRCVHERYPQAVITALDVPYTDEDLTIEVALPEGYELREVSDDLIRVCLDIEDALGVSILTQVSRLNSKEEAAN